LSILLNTIHPSEKNLKGIKQQEMVMERLSNLVAVGINLYSAGQDLDYLLEYVNRYGLKKEIRIGISHPVLSQRNVYLHPKDYRKIGSHIAQFREKALKSGVTLGFDCGFVPCMFPEEDLDSLPEEMKKAGTCCNPVIDILADGSFISCYPLNDFMKVPIDDALMARNIAAKFESALKPYTGAGIFPHCTICPLFQNRCNGGCVSYRIHRHIHMAENKYGNI
jgi:hypothetical protein